MKHNYLTVLTIALLSSSSMAYAGNIDGDALQKEAEEILKTEPGAKEVTIKVDVVPKEVAGDIVIDFQSFDLNGDGVIARDEVGEKLFEIFDRDGNHVIDNVEMKKPSLIVFTPMEKTTVEVINYHQEDKPIKTTVTHEEFLHASRLSHFDKNADGLSPLDFLGIPFNQLNVKDDAVIDLYEWKRAYAQSVTPLHMEDFNYNN